MENKKEKIAAVVVTYNRKELLKECLDALLNQTYPLDSIIIIDNASTDGTPEFLKENGYLDNPKIDYVRLPENTGGAGGQYTGIKKAYEEGFDWVWCFDDDGIAKNDALEELIKYKNENTVLNSLVIDSSNHNLLSFGLIDTTNKKKYYKTEEAEKANFINHINPFNGTLLPINIIRKIGLPEEEFFIWGDEREYLKRVLFYQFQIKTISKSKIYHPGILDKKGGLQEKRYIIPPWKIYYEVRNSLFIYKKYKNKVLLFLIVPVYISKKIGEILFYQKKKSYLKAILYATYHFLMNKMGKFEAAFDF